MAHVNLLDSRRLSELLEQALSWRKSVDSLMVSATNGAVLAFAYRAGRPTMKDIRSLSTTTTTAYTVASEDVLVFEAQLSRALSVLAPVADQVLLAVHGPGRGDLKIDGNMQGLDVNGDGTHGAEDEREEGNNAEVDEHEDEVGGAVEDTTARDGDDEEEQNRIRADLEYVSDQLAVILREELRGLRWPEDI
ncbi:uncharacterized protein AB675_5137 [Cyphellophora attinorum]|uniref:Roadblock/LAMTOR2 domain-containing protein n=1 Tax=Cyphellophora attinorum TaxID=1664694 RepID=A0A0N0NLP5_9EURO|nr:uncharacterized protein AB675_5137 [Phialophora attinorum]KPI39418.1 hypothetical protein AB675_5137 [Phialophora attinorum]